mmetsp:Transcript_15611/g.36488  ORF Transcript_15611/g.36488 Transcript_15611/m.36488 type:complete len:235 (+) Transcript_15611:65-769(+)|eukprot:CAMPEP_0171094518 /NCGR_PEP_ID=MMETSP0766_2-20121228/41403_1 /TAXON_ID=439317 /ORGANISM="Gambierdiscus australes, Strain CAWD 149" /LENGTH=234 /DNA_ID=CAMNT_0011553171 /DNA_START=57 /DNA_END=761 /DNA_ORIENTATION=+
MVAGDGGPQDNLSVGVSMGSLDAVKKACGAGADVNMAAEHTGWLPIHGAASSGSLEVLNFLVEKKADINGATFRFMQPIHLAAKEGDMSMLQRLVELKADVEAKNNMKKRPIHYACEACHRDVAQFLIQNGADPLTPDRHNCSPYDYVKMAMQKDLPDCTEISDMLKKLDCAKTGGGARQALPANAIPFTGIVVQVGEEVNKPGTWWWDPEKRMATQDPRPPGHEHPNLPRQPN